MNYQNILKETDRHIKATFAEDGEVTDICRFGSTIKKAVEPGMDIDYLFINASSHRRKYIPKIEKLRSLFNSSGAYSAAFDASDTNFKIKIASLVSRLRSEFSGILFLPKYCFGPFLRSTKDIEKHIVYLHLAGPLSRLEFQRFCDLFPVFSLSIIKNHFVVLGRNLEVYFKKPNVKTSDIVSAIIGVMQRGLSLKDIQSKKSCLRRTVLLYEMLTGGKSLEVSLLLTQLGKSEITTNWTQDLGNY